MIIEPKVNTDPPYLSHVSVLLQMQRVQTLSWHRSSWRSSWTSWASLRAQSTQPSWSSPWAQRLTRRRYSSSPKPSRPPTRLSLPLSPRPPSLPSPLLRQECPAHPRCPSPPRPPCPRRRVSRRERLRPPPRRPWRCCWLSSSKLSKLRGRKQATAWREQRAQTLQEWHPEGLFYLQTPNSLQSPAQSLQVNPPLHFHTQPSDWTHPTISFYSRLHKPFFPLHLFLKGFRHMSAIEHWFTRWNHV